MLDVKIPPAEYMFMTETPENFLQHSDELLIMATSGIDLPEGVLIDVGCGYGRMAYGLLRSGNKRPYIGIDILKKQIAWLRANFSSVAPSYEFRHFDVKNGRYNPGGTLDPADFRITDIPSPVAAIFSMSVFTHMYEADIILYLKEFKRVMSPSSVAVATAFLLDSTARRAYVFNERVNDHCSYYVREDPLLAIAYSTDWFRETLNELGFSVSFRHGYQDRLELRLL